jgi:pimeloyl-ACP methyl ester carboxylesterase
MKLYIIHGWAYSIAPWDKTVAQLRADNIEVVQLRVPGLTAESDKPWTIDEYVEWLDGELAGDPAPIVLGHSNGGRIALHYAATHTDRLKHLVLLASAGVETNHVKLSWKRRVFAVLAKALAPLKHIPLLRKAVYRLLGSDYGQAPTLMRQTLANMLASDRDFDPTVIQTPATLLWGEADKTTPLAMGEKLSSLLPNSSLYTSTEWGHAPYKTHPHELAAAILYALKEQS